MRFLETGRPLILFDPYSMQTLSRPILTLIAAIFPLLACAATEPPPGLTGVWKTVAVSPDDPNWHIEDIACMFNCSAVQYNFLLELLKDSVNNDKPLTELFEESQTYATSYLADLVTPEAKRQQEAFDPTSDPTVDCSPDGDGLRHQVTAPVPMQIEQHRDKVIFRYEYWNAVRTIYMDGRGHPTDVAESRLGHSIGHYEDASLVIDTVGMIPMSVNLPGGPVRTSPNARFVEHYTLTDEGKRLVLEYTIDDPMYFRTPYKGIVTFLLAPDWELGEWNCEAITGKF